MSAALGRARSPTPVDMAAAVTAEHGDGAVAWIEGEMTRALADGDESAALDWAGVLNVIEGVPPDC